MVKFFSTLFLLYSFYILAGNTKAQEDKSHYLQRYLKEVHQLELDSVKSYRIIILHCENCGNCDEKLRCDFASLNPAEVNICIVVHFHPIYESLKENKAYITYLDKESIIVRYGFADSYNTVLTVKKNKIKREIIID